MRNCSNLLNYSNGVHPWPTAVLLIPCGVWKQVHYPPTEAEFKSPLYVIINAPWTPTAVLLYASFEFALNEIVRALIIFFFISGNLFTHAHANFVIPPEFAVLSYSEIFDKKSSFSYRSIVLSISCNSYFFSKCLSGTAFLLAVFTYLRSYVIAQRPCTIRAPMFLSHCLWIRLYWHIVIWNRRRYFRFAPIEVDIAPIPLL